MTVRGGGAGAFTQAQSLIAVGRHTEAIELLRSAISSDPNDAYLRCQLAIALLSARQPTEALAAARSAAALAPDDEWPHRVMAYALIRLRKKKEALAAALEAMRLDPANPSVIGVTGEAQLACGEIDDAEVTASRLIELAPDNPAGFNLRGRSALKRKRFDGAEAAFREALRLEPDNWASNNNLGVALQGQRRKKEAVEAFERAAKANPNARLARRNLFGATQAYVGGGLVILLVLIRVLPAVERADHLPSGLTVPVFIAGLLVVGAGYWLLRRRRLRQLGPAVDRFYQLEIARERKIQVLHVLYQAGPPIVVVLVLMGLAAAQTPGFKTWLVAGAALMLTWTLASPRLWRNAILPRLRPDD